MNNNIFKTIKMKIREGEGEGSDYNSSSCDLDKTLLSKRRASVCQMGGDEPYEKREKRGRSVPIIRKAPIILRLRNNYPALSASPVPEQSSKNLSNYRTTEKVDDLTLCVQGLKICPKLPTVKLRKLKLKTRVIEQLRLGAKPQELNRKKVKLAKTPIQPKVPPPKKKKTCP